MADFNIAYQITNAIEGGYVNDPDDPGGETYKGISRVYNPYWKGWEIIDDLKRATGFPETAYKHKHLNELKRQLYKTMYWDVNKLDDVHNQAIANEMYDTGVNMSAVLVAEYLQQALNLANDRGRLYPDIVEDAMIGKRTLHALHQHPNPAVILKILNVLQGHRYIQLARKNPKLEKYINGWYKRVFEIDLNTATAA